MSIRSRITRDDYLNILQPTLNLKLTLVQRLGQRLSAQGQSALQQTCLPIISPSPSHFARQTHVCSPINYYSSLSIIGAYNYSVHFSVPCTITFFFAAIIMLEQWANWDLFHCRTINLVWVDLSGSKCVCRSYNMLFGGMNEVSPPEISALFKNVLCSPVWIHQICGLILLLCCSCGANCSITSYIVHNKMRWFVLNWTKCVCKKQFYTDSKNNIVGLFLLDCEKVLTHSVNVLLI